MTRRTLPACLLIVLAGLLSASASWAQNVSPVFLPDSQRAAEALPRALELASSELYDEASRVLDELIRTDADLLLPGDDGAGVHTPVRTRIIEALLRRPALLERDRELRGPVARALLETGDLERVEREYLLTAAGFDAALLLARERTDDARFHSAWRTLAQLDRHPDRTGARADDAARALSDVWRVLEALGQTDDLPPGAREMLDRWRAGAGLGAALTPAQIPSLPVVRTPFDDPGPVRIEGVLAQPLISRETGNVPRVVVDEAAVRDEDIPPGARLLHSAPILVGDTVYTNTTETIAAWNRFTGQQLWSTRIIAPIRLISRNFRVEQRLEELATLVASDRTLVALTGVPATGAVPERLLIGLDPRTGEERWRAALTETLDERLQTAVFHGPPVLCEGVVVVAASDNDTNKRTIVHHLVGFDAHTGRHLWTRTVASMGIRPYSEIARPSEGLASCGADVVYVSSLGAVARLDALTGRPRWIREEPVEDRPRIVPIPAPWRFHTPVVTRDRLFTLSPDRRWILELDPHSGERRARSRTTRWDDPHTLHLVGDTLVGISDRRAVMCPADRIEDADDLAMLAVLPGPRGTPIRGRTVRAGERLYFPLTNGIYTLPVPQPDERWLDGAPPTVDGRLIELDHSGNPLLLDGQVVIADDTRLHTYFAWEVARELLIEREGDAPDDPTAPVTYAQLAYRAGETDDILPALDRASRALVADPLRPDFNELRRTMFDAVLAMARPDRDPSRLASLSGALRRELLERLSLLARTPDERVSALMTAGAYFEAINDAPRAIDRYQRLLADADLRDQQYAYAGVRMPVAEEAARRLTSVVSFAGREAYEPYDRAARARAESLPDGAGVDERLDIARTFPLATVTPELYLAIGEQHEREGERRRAIEAYETGLRLMLPGDRPDLAAELAGRAVVEAVLAGRLSAARLRLRDASTFLQSDALTYRSRRIDTERLRERIESLERSAQQRPRLAREILPEPDILPGLRVLEPIIREGVTPPTDLVLLKRTDVDEFGLWGVSGAGVLEERWGGLVGHDPVLLDNESLYTTTLDNDTPGRRKFHRFDIATGRERWSTLAFEDLWNPAINTSLTRIPEDTVFSEGDPLRDDQTAKELLVSVSDGVLVLVERSGRVVGVDMRTGRPLWAQRLPLMRVLDAHAGSGVVASIGLRRRTLEELGRARVEPPVIEERLVTLDIRTGEILYDPTLEELARWVRVTPGADVLVGCEGLVQQYALRSGRLLASAMIDDLPDTMGLANLPGRVYAISPFGPLICINVGSGRLAHERVDTGGRIINNAGDFRGELIDGRAYLASAMGFCALDERNTLVAADTRPPGSPTLIPVFSEDAAYAVSLRGEESMSPGVRTYDLSVRDLATGRLIDDPLRIPLPARPDTLRLIDGHVLISAGGSTVVLHAPPAAPAGRDDAPVFELEDVYADTATVTTTPAEPDSP
ncbi:MAG: hypothetical protein Tsb0013_08350 [Phycisphaerales bacterium]